MARYSRKKRSRRYSSIRRADIAKKPSVELGKSTVERRSARRQIETPIRSEKRSSGNGGEIGSFLRRNIKAVAVVAFVIVVGGIVAGILLSGKQTTQVVQDQQQGEQVAMASPEHTDMPEEAFAEYNEETGYNYDGVDDSVLAGLTGSDDSLFEDMDEEMEDAVFEAEGIRIGVTLGDLKSSTDKLYLSKLEQASNDAEVSRLVYEVYYYNAQGDFNQQLQDVRSLIKNEVDAIIVGNSDKEAFDMVQAMANNAGIPVVAYNAPEGATGYAINIVPDNTQWGKTYGEFVAQNLTSGNVLQVLGSEKVDADLLRAAGISEALATNENIRVEETVYGKWDEDDAYDAVEEFLDEEGYISGIITEEGMAEGILDAYIDVQLLPKVMCGDVSAGFLKTWYELKTKGVEIEIQPEDDDEEPYTIMFKAKSTEMIVMAQPTPENIGAVAFEIAYQLANGRTLKNEGRTFVYNVETVITKANLPKYYAMVSEKQDDYLLRDMITQETLDSLLNPAVEEEQESEE